MSRSKINGAIRDVAPDEVYGSKIISKLINFLMYSGEKAIAAGIVYGSLDDLADLIRKCYKDENEGRSTPSDAAAVIFFLELILNKIAIYVELKTRRVGGANYRVPVEIKQLSLVIRRSISRIVRCARKRGERTMQKRLAAELRDILNNTGESIRARDLELREIEASRAFAHLAR